MSGKTVDKLAQKLGSKVALGQAIDKCRNRISLEEEKIRAIVDPIFESEGRSSFGVVVGIHECDKSPFAICAYEYFDDPAWDSCIYCGDPHERK
jgi:hypothetical protein